MQNAGFSELSNMYTVQGMKRTRNLFSWQKIEKTLLKENSNEKRTCFYSSMSMNGQEAQRQWHGHARDSRGYSLEGGQELLLLEEAPELANEQTQAIYNPSQRHRHLFFKQQQSIKRRVANEALITMNVFTVFSEFGK